MRMGSVPRTGLIASTLCLGTGDMGAGIDRKTSFQMLDMFIESGGNFLDTAKIYSDWIPGETSRSEKLIGTWIKDRRNRENIVLATKGAHPDLNHMDCPRLSPEEIAADLEASLQHLQVDTIDLYWLHRDDPNRPVDEIIDHLNSLVNAGKIRYFGCSNWKVERIRAAEEYASENGLQSFSAVQNLWNLAQVNPDGFADKTIEFVLGEMQRYHVENNLASVPYSSQANGLFQKLDRAKPEELPANLLAWYWNPVTKLRYRRIFAMREQTGMTITQIVLGYLISQPFPTFPIIGPKSTLQLQDCLTAQDVVLDQTQVESLTL